MPEIKNNRLDQYGTKPFEQQQFGTAAIEGVNYCETFDSRFSFGRGVFSDSVAAVISTVSLETTRGSLNLENSH